MQLVPLANPPPPPPSGPRQKQFADAAAAAAPAQSSLAALLSSHVLRDGEVVLLILKPSLWFVPLQSIFFSGVVLFVIIGAALVDAQRQWHRGFYLESAAFLIAGRLMWATLHWMGRLYVLTDMRVLRLAGIFQIDIFDCPLRKVRHVQPMNTLREKLLGLGSILIIPKNDGKAPALWQTIARPFEVHEKLVAAINKANQSGLGTP